MSKENILKNKLKDNGIDENYYDYLFKYLSNKDNIEDAIEDLIKGRPIQYIVGNVEFYNSIINVNESVLIPRFETELLVDKLVKYCNKKFFDKINILDMCTGSGCIAISLKKELDCNVIGVDISKDALLVARDNAKSNDVEINFVESDLFDEVSGKYNVIVSNPPYISYNEEIMDIVRNNEPNIALYAEDNGLYFYKKIIDNIRGFLCDDFIVAFEIGMSQANDIVNVIKCNLSNVEVIVEKDFNDRDRFIFIISK